MDQAPAITPLGFVAIGIVVVILLRAILHQDDRPKEVKKLEENPQRAAALAILYKKNRPLLESGNAEKVEEAIACQIEIDRAKSERRQGSSLTAGIIVATIIVIAFIISTVAHN